MDSMCSTSADTVRSLHFPSAPDSTPTATIPISESFSPPSSPTPLDSEDTDSMEIESDSGSVSSFPSMSSSFFFSSAAASPGPPSDAPLDDTPSGSNGGHPRHQQIHHHEQEATATTRWPHGHSKLAEDDAMAEEDQGLIIPSLILPEALRRPTPFGQTLGKLKLVVIGEHAREMVNDLLDMTENMEVVHLDMWSDAVDRDEEEGWWRREASTDWIEREPQQQQRRRSSVIQEESNVEPIRNVEVIALTSLDDAQSQIRSQIHIPFHRLGSLVNPNIDPSNALAQFLASPRTPLYTAVILAEPYSDILYDYLNDSQALSSASSSETSSPTFDDLSSMIPPPVPPPIPPSWLDPLASLSVPIIPLPSSLFSTSPQHKRRPGKRRGSQHLKNLTFPGQAKRLKISAFAPPTLAALRTGLFRSPETIAMLRMESAMAFLRWREVERAVMAIVSSSPESSLVVRAEGEEDEEEMAMDERMRSTIRDEFWEDELSVQVAKRLRIKTSPGPKVSATAFVLGAPMQPGSPTVVRGDAPPLLPPLSSRPPLASSGTMVGRRPSLPPVNPTFTIANTAPRSQSAVAGTVPRQRLSTRSPLRSPSTSPSALGTCIPLPLPISLSATGKPQLDTSVSSTSTEVRFPLGSSLTAGVGAGMMASFDPLHFPSLVMFSISLLGPLRRRVLERVGLSSTATPSAPPDSVTSRNADVIPLKKRDYATVPSRRRGEARTGGSASGSGMVRGLWMGIGIGVVIGLGFGLGLIVSRSDSPRMA